MEAFSDNISYANKHIEMWDQVWKSQNLLTPKALLANLYILFGILQDSTQ